MEADQKSKQKFMRAVQYEIGAPEKLSIGHVPVPTLKGKEVLIRVIATTVNRADTIQRKGNYPPPPGASEILGLDAAGFVDSLGPDCTPGRWKIGDRVMALLAGGGNAEYVSSHEDHLMPVPEGLTLVEAAAIPEAWLTAYQILKFVGKVKAGETVLIHAAGSGVGTAAIQLTQVFNATPIAIAGSGEKLDMAIRLGAVTAVNYKEERFVPKVLEATGGLGVNLILDCVAGSFSQQNCESIARDGRWVIYGTLGGPNASDAFLRQILAKRINLIGTTLRARTNEYKADLVKAFTEEVLPHFASKELKLIIDKVYSMGQISAAHEQMEENRNTGKIIVEVQNEDKPVSTKEEL